MLTIEEKQEKLKRRQAAHEQICRDYAKLKEQYPTESPYCLFETLAQRYRNKGLMFYPWSSMGVREILKRNGKFASAKRQKPKPATAKRQKP